MTFSTKPAFGTPYRHHRPAAILASGAPTVTTFDIDVMSGDGATWLSLRGEFDIANAPHLEREIRRFADAGGARLVIDLRGLSFIDSTGLRIVLETRQRAADQGFGLEIVRGPAQVQRVFELTGLDDRLPFVDEAS